jgi:hypothetical protein
MPETLSIQGFVDVTYEKYSSSDDGEITSYIAELSTADPRDFDICLVTVDGQIFCAIGRRTDGGGESPSRRRCVFSLAGCERQQHSRHYGVQRMASRLGGHAFEFTNVGSSFVQPLFWSSLVRFPPAFLRRPHYNAWFAHGDFA